MNNGKMRPLSTGSVKLGDNGLCGADRYAALMATADDQFRRRLGFQHLPDPEKNWPPFIQEAEKRRRQYHEEDLAAGRFDEARAWWDFLCQQGPVCVMILPAATADLFATFLKSLEVSDG